MSFSAIRVLLGIALSIIATSCSHNANDVTCPVARDVAPVTLDMEPVTADSHPTFRQITRCNWTHSLYHPAWSPDGTRIAYGANYTNLLRHQIYTIRIGEREPVMVADFGNFSAYEPAWSPDGTRIACAILSYSIAQIAVHDLTTGQHFVLPLGSAKVRHPDWTTDGKIVYQHYRPSTLFTINVADMSGTSVQLIDNPAFDPDINPDGDIVFHSSRGGNLNIWMLRSGETEPIQLTDSPADEVEPAWSPDGRRIAYQSGADGCQDVWIMNADGSHQRQLTHFPGRDRHPTWSPDGRRIAFVSERSGRDEIWVATF
ncbi:MAG: hypothetical protein V1778_05105 [bacterium]